MFGIIWQDTTSNKACIMLIKSTAYFCFFRFHKSCLILNAFYPLVYLTNWNSAMLSVKHVHSVSVDPWWSAVSCTRVNGP